MISVWLRVIRVRFLLASVIAVLVGLAINWSQNGFQLVILMHFDFCRSNGTSCKC